MKKTRVISAFPATGKSTLANYMDTGKTFLDLDSSEFNYALDSEGNPTDQLNPVDVKMDLYIKAITNEVRSGKYDYVMVSTHPVVVEAVSKLGVSWIGVMPLKSCRDHWIERILQRDDNKALAHFVRVNWEEITSFEDGLDEKNMIQYILLGADQYLSEDYIWDRGLRQKI